MEQVGLINDKMFCRYLHVLADQPSFDSCLTVYIQEHLCDDPVRGFVLLIIEDWHDCLTLASFSLFEVTRPPILVVGRAVDFIFPPHDSEAVDRAALSLTASQSLHTHSLMQNIASRVPFGSLLGSSSKSISRLFLAPTLFDHRHPSHSRSHSTTYPLRADRYKLRPQSRSRAGSYSRVFLRDSRRVYQHIFKMNPFQRIVLPRPTSVNPASGYSSASELQAGDIRPNIAALPPGVLPPLSQAALADANALEASFQALSTAAAPTDHVTLPSARSGPMSVASFSGFKTRALPSSRSPSNSLNRARKTKDSSAAVGGRSKRAAKGIKRKGYQERALAASVPGREQPERDAVLPPSPASGGVPEPTPTYLRQAGLNPSRLSQPRTILVVMDLNGTLLFRPDRTKPRSFVERPFACRFMQYCIDTFKVVVWSSARPLNVGIMCEQLLGGPVPPDDNNASNISAGPGVGALRNSDEATRSYRDRLVAVWARDRFGLTPSDYNSRVQCYKRLESLWADPVVRASHPDAARGGRWDQSNTILVDDSVEKARSEPHNLLCIPEFAGDPATESATEAGLVLPQVHDYLNELSWQVDISQYVRANPFRLSGDYSLDPQRD